MQHIERTYERAQAAGRGGEAGFTLIEILIVMVILGILGATVIPQLISLGADKRARITTTKANLQQLNHVIRQYRIKNGKYPESLQVLLTETFTDMGTQQPYLRAMPQEMVSSEDGSSTAETVDDVTLAKFDASQLPGDGGWVYLKDSAAVVVDVNEPLGSEWGDDAGEKPWTW